MSDQHTPHSNTRGSRPETSDLAREDVKHLQAGEGAAMPEGLLSEVEIRDLFIYLRGASKVPPRGEKK